MLEASYWYQRMGFKAIPISNLGNLQVVHLEVQVLRSTTGAGQNHMPWRFTGHPILGALGSCNVNVMVETLGKLEQ